MIVTDNPNLEEQAADRPDAFEVAYKRYEARFSYVSLAICRALGVWARIVAPIGEGVRCEIDVTPKEWKYATDIKRGYGGYHIAKIYQYIGDTSKPDLVAGIYFTLRHTADYYQCSRNQKRHHVKGFKGSEEDMVFSAVKGIINKLLRKMRQPSFKIKLELELLAGEYEVKL